ncbi:DUF1778 domain-containing protein [Bifidobacterium simiarum]|uniref:type II toxin-antitoxin system TacA family antitoxin n=1 Tax=Bifidobacterium simiarum TaxID=2045441 RepID=UPI001BDC85D3|nr:DUF1778 domain-containing protein [Bifidobacterium simiarum]MBT1167276.1 DUF1778 domain-containing protein [Bifidobacterium simiarum]
MRMTGEQRERIDRAASINGQSAAQWALGHLMEAANRDIREAHVIRLSDEAYDDFISALDEPMPKAMTDLLAKEPEWR